MISIPVPPFAHFTMGVLRLGSSRERRSSLKMLFPPLLFGTNWKVAVPKEFSEEFFESFWGVFGEFIRDFLGEFLLVYYIPQ